MIKMLLYRSSINLLTIALVIAGLLLAFGSNPAQCQAGSGPVTITGSVFIDANANGLRDSGEKGIAGVVVSNGIGCVRTDDNGDYKLANTDTSRCRFVHVVTPTGYKNSSPFYKAMSAGTAADFGLVTAPETASSDFSFVQITDLHIPKTTNLAGDLKDIAGHKPAFVIATGDLVERGTIRESYETYKSVVDNSPVPVKSVMGNHDQPLSNYEEFLGPSYYSFDCGGRHFIVLNCVARELGKRQLAWLKSDMALQPKGKEVFVFQHYPPSPELMDMLTQYNTKAFFSGHWHSSKVLNYKGITFVNTPSQAFGGIDVSPRGYRVVSFSKGRMSFEDGHAGCREHLAIASPAAGSEVSRGKVEIRAGAYDSSSPVAKVEYQIDNGPRRQMKQAGKLSWAAWDTIKTPGAHTITVTCSFASGASVTKESRFQIIDAAFPAPKTGENWPMAGHDTTRSGVTGDAVAPPLYPAWTASLGGRTHISSPVVAGNLVYVSISDEECKNTAGVCALDASTGKLKWKFATAASVKNSPVVDGSSVYCVTVDGNVYALDAKSGKQMWTYSLGGPLDRWVYASPAVSDGVVYVGSASNFVALDAKTGNQLWQTKAFGGEWISCHTSPTLGKDALFMGVNWSGGTFAVNKATGDHLWNVKASNVAHASPMLMGDTLFFPANSKLCAIDSATGATKWSYPIPGWPLSTPAGRGSTVYVGTCDGRIAALNSADGKEKWSFQTGDPILFFAPYSADGGSIVSQPAVSGNVVYCGSVDGQLYALDADTGAKLWSYDTGVPVTSSPAVSGNTVYVCGFDGTLFAFTSTKSK